MLAFIANTANQAGVADSLRSPDLAPDLYVSNNVIIIV